MKQTKNEPKNENKAAPDNGKPKKERKPLTEAQRLKRQKMICLLYTSFRHIAGLWRSLDSTVAEQGKDKEIPHADTSDIIGKSRFKICLLYTSRCV